MTGDETTGQEILQRFTDAIAKLDFDVLRELLHPDFVQEIPQSGERVRGAENFIEILQHYPDWESRSVDQSSHRVVIRPERRYVMTPSFKVLQVAGSGEHLASFNKTQYPDGQWWYIVHLVTLRDGKVARSVEFWAQPFEPPQWRAQWVEPMEE